MYVTKINSGIILCLSDVVSVLTFYFQLYIISLNSKILNMIFQKEFMGLKLLAKLAVVLSPGSLGPYWTTLPSILSRVETLCWPALSGSTQKCPG